MRAKEFIIEEKSGLNHEYVSRPVRAFLKYPKLDQYYEVYRFGIAVASEPGHESNGEILGPTKDNPITVCYT
ncbi:MAG: hypothetical protein N2235_02400, partial [Fischerella sp.]|nr:hypothetical protein [Fischerella sp.]